jgi:hypothetical protein
MRTNTLQLICKALHKDFSLVDQLWQCSRSFPTTSRHGQMTRQMEIVKAHRAAP